MQPLKIQTRTMFENDSELDKSFICNKEYRLVQHVVFLFGKICISKFYLTLQLSGALISQLVVKGNPEYSYIVNSKEMHILTNSKQTNKKQ